MSKVESYIARLRTPCGVTPKVQREVADILEQVREAVSHRGAQADAFILDRVIAAVDPRYWCDPVGGGSAHD